jgi:hypothetical protein
MVKDILIVKRRTIIKVSAGHHQLILTSPIMTIFFIIKALFSPQNQGRSYNDEDMTRLTGHIFNDRRKFDSFVKAKPYNWNMSKILDTSNLTLANISDTFDELWKLTQS